MASTSKKIKPPKSDGSGDCTIAVNQDKKKPDSKGVESVGSGDLNAATQDSSKKKPKMVPVGSRYTKNAALPTTSKSKNEQIPGSTVKPSSGSSAVESAATSKEETNAISAVMLEQLLFSSSEEADSTVKATSGSEDMEIVGGLIQREEAESPGCPDRIDEMACIAYGSLKLLKDHKHHCKDVMDELEKIAEDSENAHRRMYEDKVEHHKHRSQRLASDVIDTLKPALKQLRERLPQLKPKLECFMDALNNLAHIMEVDVKAVAMPVNVEETTNLAAEISMLNNELAKFALKFDAGLGNGNDAGLANGIRQFLTACDQIHIASDLVNKNETLVRDMEKLVKEEDYLKVYLHLLGNEKPISSILDELYD